MWTRPCRLTAALLPLLLRIASYRIHLTTPSPAARRHSMELCSMMRFSRGMLQNQHPQKSEPATVGSGQISLVPSPEGGMGVRAAHCSWLRMNAFDAPSFS